MRLFRISSRDYVKVQKDNWSMFYYPNGEYFIYRGGKEVAHGKYDAIIADSYNSQMNSQDRDENLTRDLISWIEKAIKGKVTD